MPVRREKWAGDLATLRMQYAIVDAWNKGATIIDINQQSSLAEERITGCIPAHERFPLPWVDDRLGRCPQEVILMYAVGEIGWEQCLEELGTWPYLPMPDANDSWNDVAIDPPGSVQDLSIARGRELSHSEYAQILARYQQHLQQNGDDQ